MSPSPTTESLVPHLAAARGLARYLLRNSADADDVVQEAYARALRHCAKVRHVDSRQWMLAIVRHVGYDWIRRRRRASLTHGVSDMEQIQAVAPSPEANLLVSLHETEVRKAVDRLPAIYRTVVVLRDLEEWPYRDIAEQVRLPIGTVMSRLARGRTKLRALLENSPLSANYFESLKRRKFHNERCASDRRER